MNQTKPALASAAVRRAVVDALDVPTLVTSVFGDTATAMPDAYPAPLIPAGTSPNPHPYDTAAIKGALPAGLKLTVVYTPDSSGVERRFADLMRQRLATFGVDVTEQQVQLSVVYGYRDNTQKAADIYISTPAPDAATPDAWARILWYTKGGLNFFNYSNPAVDAKIDAGLRSDDQAQADQNYAEAGKLAVSDSGEVPIAQVSDVIATNKDITGMEHVPAYPWTLNLASLARK
jgi:peptide/nickel transport system substrate-binding protein